MASKYLWRGEALRKYIVDPPLGIAALVFEVSKSTLLMTGRLTKGNGDLPRSCGVGLILAWEHPGGEGERRCLPVGLAAVLPAELLLSPSMFGTANPGAYMYNLSRVYVRGRYPQPDPLPFGLRTPSKSALPSTRPNSNRPVNAVLGSVASTLSV